MAINGNTLATLKRGQKAIIRAIDAADEGPAAHNGLATGVPGQLDRPTRLAG